MSQSQIDFQGVLQLVELIKSSSNFSEIRIRSGDVEVELRRHGGASLFTSPATPAQTTPLQPTPAQPAPLQAAPLQAGAAPAASQTPPSVAKSARAAPVPEREGTTLVRAPMVGTVYHAPEAGATPFVQIGQTVARTDQVCIVEVMKLMNSIPAGCDGVVSEILVGDGEAVEFGQPIFVIATR